MTPNIAVFWISPFFWIPKSGGFEGFNCNILRHSWLTLDLINHLPTNDITLMPVIWFWLTRFAVRNKVISDHNKVTRSKYISQDEKWVISKPIFPGKPWAHQLPLSLSQAWPKIMSTCSSSSLPTTSRVTTTLTTPKITWCGTVRKVLRGTMTLGRLSRYRMLFND